MPLLPLRIIDIVFSSGIIIFCAWSLYVLFNIYRTNRDVIFFRYLFILALTLCIFSLSRGMGHILRNILFFIGEGHRWSSISPFSGGINSIVFIIVGLVFLLSLDTKKLMRQFCDIRSRHRTALLNSRFKSSILNAMEYPAMVIGPDYRIIEANRAFYHAFGVSPETTDPVLCYKVTHGLDRPCHEEGITCLMKKTLKEGKTFKTIHTHRTPEGQRIHHVIYNPIFQDDRCSWVLEMVRDITEDVKREKAVRKRLKEIYEHRQAASIRSLVAGICHEFNNALTGVLGNAEILKAKLQKRPELQKHLDAIMTSAQKITEFVRQMMLYTKEQTLKMERFDLGQFLDRFVSIVSIPENIKLDYKRQALPMPVQGDQDSLAECITHLIDNARDAMPRGGDLTITVSVEEIRAREMAVIKIKDTGHGISPQFIDHIFDPFFTTKDVGKGTGLGLCLVKGIIEAHRGWIELESIPEKGTEVRLYLPLH